MESMSLAMRSLTVRELGIFMIERTRGTIEGLSLSMATHSTGLRLKNRERPSLKSL